MCLNENALKLTGISKAAVSTNYTTDGNMTASVTGGDGNTVTYTNDTELSLTTAVTDPRGNSTLSTYDELRRLVSSSCGSAEVSYTYSDDLLTELRHSNTGTSDTVYTFVYGPGGLTEEVKVGDTVLSANTYTPGTWTLSQQTFGNGQWWKYSYDRMDTLLERYTNITAASGIAFVYHYNSKGLLSRIDLCEVSFDDTRITSSTLVSSEKYYYDASDRLYKVEEVTPGDDSYEITVHSYECEFDAKENVTRLVETIEGTSYTYSFTYDADGRPTAVTYGGITETVSYDALGRTGSATISDGTGAPIVSREYTYVDPDDDTALTTTLVQSVNNIVGTDTLGFSYRYDANGNITRADDGTSTTRYTYNSRNELAWEKNAAAGKAWYYNHDYGGNITRRTEYDYIDGETSGTGITVTYRYGDSGWKDKLTAYNGQTITYDAIGNPLSYRGMTMTWQGGRQLASVTNGGTALSFAYNEAGLRTSKNVNGSEHKYYWTNGKLSAEICDDYSLFFHYNANGDILGYSYSTNGTTTEYYYVKNLQGDILRVIDVSGTVAASYTYDAWGRLLSSSGSMASINPIRYRGYYYDTETGLYYLQSRYYDPEVCRFINADAYVSTGQGILGCNMFAYCGNNPENADDHNGKYYTPLQIHNFVIDDICDSNPNMSSKDTYIKYETTHKRGNKTYSYGFCDLYNTSTWEAWEVKRFGGGPSCTKGSAMAQLAGYVSEKLFYHDMQVLKTGGTKTIIPSNTFCVPDNDGGGYYNITYWDAGDGIVFYDYMYVPSLREIGYVGIALGIAISTVFPETIPVTAYASTLMG